MSTLLRPPHWFVRQATYGTDKLIHAKRFAEKMAGALPKQIARFVLARIAGHETNRDINVQFSNSVESLRTIEARHLDVEENDRDLAAVITAMIESFLAV